MHYYADTSLKKISGLTLIELMIALAISLFIFSIITTIYLTAENNFRLQSSSSELQENARLVIKMLTSEIKMAGYIGCGKLTNDFPIINHSGYDFNWQNKISLIDNKLTLRKASSLHANLVSTINNQFELSLTMKPKFAAGDILLISDCKKAEIFKVKNACIIGDTQFITSIQPLVYQFDKFAEVNQLEINTYFTDKTKRKTRLGKPIYAIYKQGISQHKVELVENVEMMKIKFDSTQENIVGLNIKLTISSFLGELKNWDTYVTLRSH